MSTLRATAILSSSSFVTILVGLVSTKAWAVLLGPSGLGYMGLLQSLVGLAGLIAGAGIGTGLVRMGAHALAQGDLVQVAALRRATWLLVWAIGGVVAGLMVIFRSLISAWMLGGQEHQWAAAAMSITLIFSLAAGVQTSLLNAHHRVTALAQASVVSSVIGAVASLLFIWAWHERGVVPALVASSCVQWVITSWICRRDVTMTVARPSTRATLAAVSSLLRFGVPYSASMVVGTGVQFALPALVLHMLGEDGVGHYRAAVAISVTYLGFMLTAMGLDYYPRVSAVSDQADTVVHLVNAQLRLILMLIVPLIFGMLALSSTIIPRLYSKAFSPASGILEWQLVGELFRFWSWTIGMALLARGRSRTIFLVELAFGINILLLSYLGMKWIGLMGSGIGFLAAYASHFLLVWAIVRRDIGLRWTPTNAKLMLATLVALASLQSLNIAGYDVLARAVSLSLAVLTGLWSLNALWTEYTRGRNAPSDSVTVAASEA